jgi:cellulose biosynthesis protein BcsQ
MKRQSKNCTDECEEIWQAKHNINKLLDCLATGAYLRLPSQLIMKPIRRNKSQVAFYSFKGGVGRTLHLAAHLFALLDRARELDTGITVLVIDADLEAPGLTYWNANEKQQPTVSFIDFLEVYHYPPTELEETLSLFAREIKKSPKHEGKSTVYFLPACLNDKQLLDTPILPENLVRTPDGNWECGNALYRLGNALGADYVLVDLRAGLSEISSPIIFDSRIQRFLVTTLTKQSISGTSLVLEQIGRVAPPEADVSDGRYYDPSLIISMLTKELRSLPEFENAFVKFQSAYVQPEEDNPYSTRLEIKETYFNQELLYINNWEEARAKVSPTLVMEIAKEWAEGQLKAPTSQNLQLGSTRKPELLEAVRSLRDICQQYEFAEEGQGEDLLVTDPLKNLATTFRYELPRVVSIGAKGAGKTFNYIQLSRFKYWESFLQRIDGKELESNSKTYIFPLLQSGKLSDNAKDVINEARREIATAVDEQLNFVPSECIDRIKIAISEQNWSEPRWTEFWIGEISKSIGIELGTNGSYSLSNINRQLKDKSLRVIFIFDGLEDIFPDIASNDKQKVALRALIDDLPNKLSEIRQANLGVIILLRRDFLRYTITQNLRQFENLYRPYDLAWDQDSFLRLVFWQRASEVLSEKWSSSRLLPPQAIRRALKSCSEKKVDEAKEEYPVFKRWVDEILPSYLQAERRIPFSVEQFGLEQSTVRILEEMGVIYEDKEKEDTARFYMPEIFREGLGFSGKGARPRVLALKRKVLGRGIV